MKSSFLRKIACLAIVLFVIGTLENSTVLASPLWVWMELESANPISLSDEPAECFIISNKGRNCDKAIVTRSARKYKLVQFNGENSYLQSWYPDDVDSPPVILNDDELENGYDVDKNNYTTLTYYLTKIAFECDDRDRAQYLVNLGKNNPFYASNPFGGITMTPVLVGATLNGPRMPAYLSFSNKTTTSIGKIIREQDAKPFDLIPRFVATHKGGGVWQFYPDSVVTVLKPIPQKL